MRRSLHVCLALCLLSTAWGQEKRTKVVPTTDAPVKIVRIGNGNWFVDFGKAAFGNVEFIEPAKGSERKIRLHLGEARIGEDHVDRKPYPSSTVRYQTQEILSKPGVAVSPQLTWAPPGWMKSGWLKVQQGMPEVMPFRYVEVEGFSDKLTPECIRRVSWAVPFKAGVSGFKSSSPELDSVWDLSAHTIKATSFLGIYVDGDRERRPYEADILINQLGHFCLDADYETSRNSLDFLASNPTWPTEWRQQTVLLAWDEFLWSGDDGFIKERYPLLQERSMLDRRTPDGLFLGYPDGAVKDIVDWPGVERDGYEMGLPVKSVVTAFYYRDLVLLAKIATHLGKTEDAAKFTSLADQTKKTFNEKLWDDRKGCYVDGLDPATGKASTHASAHATFMPLALGLVPQDRVAKCGDFLKSKGMVCSVYGSQFLLEALAEAGEGKEMLKLLTSSELRSWRNMMAKTGTTIAMEAWDMSLKPNQDWNHAWGAAPANIIPRKLMGVEPIEPGFTRFSVKPLLTGLADSAVKVPTPKGSIILTMASKGAAWKATLTVPEGTTAEFYAPTAKVPAAKSANGTAKQLRTENGRAVLELAPGSWSISQ